MNTVTQLEATIAELDQQILVLNVQINNSIAQRDAEIEAELSKIKERIEAKYAPKLAELREKRDALAHQKRPLVDEAIARKQHPDEGRIFVTWETRSGAQLGDGRYYEDYIVPAWYVVQTLRTWEDAASLSDRQRHRPQPGETILRRVDAKGRPLKSWTRFTSLDKLRDYRPTSAIRPLPKGVLLGHPDYRYGEGVFDAFHQQGVIN